MKKIKKFRVQSRSSAVLRSLKALTGDTRLTPELEKAVEQEINNAQDLYSTAALYSTYNTEQSPAWAGTLWESKNENGARPVALTLFAATVGPALERELASSIDRGENLRSQILTCLGEEAADQASNFIYRLLQEEAKQESCELSDRRAPETEQQRELLSILEADKIPVVLDDKGHLTPRFSRAGYILWWPPAKQRRGAK
jgi:hypothetical protein